MSELRRCAWACLVGVAVSTILAVVSSPPGWACSMTAVLAFLIVYCGRQ